MRLRNQGILYGMNRLLVLDSDLASMLEHMEPVALSKIAVTATSAAIRAANLVDPLVDAILHKLEVGSQISGTDRESVRLLLEQLDEEQWRLHDVARSQGEQLRALNAFQKARVANALLFALANATCSSTCETLYESHAAGVQLETLRSFCRPGYGIASR